MTARRASRGDRARRRGAVLTALALLASACGSETPDEVARSIDDAVAPDDAGADLVLLRSLSLASLPPPPPNASNAVADDARAAALGHRLFFDPGLSANGAVACASCHAPERFFTDGLALSRGIGTTARNAPTVVASAFAAWLFWDGRRDSLWAQALAPLETDVEMGSTRVEVVRRVALEGPHTHLYRDVFGPPPAALDAERLPERAGPFGDAQARTAWASLDAATRLAVDGVFANVGKALEAYQRRLLPGPTRFDRYADALVAGDERAAARWLDADERAGLRLFLDAGRTQCLRCHNGPLLTNQGFHHVGTSAGRETLPDLGRFLGIQAVQLDPFNCEGPYSDAAPEQCGELRFLATDDAGSRIGSFKTPTLRGVAATAPYMHDGRFATLAEVVEHYRRPPPPPHELAPLDLTEREAAQLAAFLATLGPELAGDARWRAAPDD